MILKGQKYHFQVRRFCGLGLWDWKDILLKFAPNFSKNKLLGENAVAPLHESCLLRIMGSAPLFINYSSQNSMRKKGDKMSNEVGYKKGVQRKKVSEKERSKKIRKHE